MRTRARGLPLRAVLAAVAGCTALLLLTACQGESSADMSQAGVYRAPVHLGGPTPASHPVPTRTMDRMERAVADELGEQVAREGLSLDYLDCPTWDRLVPATLTCQGYVDGLVAGVQVTLGKEASEAAPVFDARILTGMISTRALEETLREQGWALPDCGDVPVYPAHVGEQIVCRVERDGRWHYLSATVSATGGEVTIADYLRAGTGAKAG